MSYDSHNQSLLEKEEKRVEQADERQEGLYNLYWNDPEVWLEALSNFGCDPDYRMQMSVAYFDMKDGHPEAREHFYQTFVSAFGKWCEDQAKATMEAKG